MVDASPPGAATPPPGEDEGAPAGDGGPPPPGADGTTGPTGPRPRSPRRLRSLLIGVVIAALLAVLLFVVLRPASTGTNGDGRSPGVAVGDRAPDFTLPRLGGGASVHLDALGVDRHRPVILNFFASWCGPCQAETPMLAQAADAAAAANSRLQFVGVDVNDPSTNALDFVHRSGVTYPVGSDRTLKVTSVDYALNGQPNTFFIDASGHVIGQRLGALSPAELQQWTKRLTGGG